MSLIENVMERLNLQEKRNTYAAVSAGILVSIDGDVSFVRCFPVFLLYVC